MGRKAVRKEGIDMGEAIKSILLHANTVRMGKRSKMARARVVRISGTRGGDNDARQEAKT